MEQKKEPKERVEERNYKQLMVILNSLSVEVLLFCNSKYELKFKSQFKLEFEFEFKLVFEFKNKIYLYLCIRTQ